MCINLCTKNFGYSIEYHEYMVRPPASVPIESDPSRRAGAFLVVPAGPPAPSGLAIPIITATCRSTWHDECPTSHTPGRGPSACVGRAGSIISQGGARARAAIDH
jgi:hypothetical protein